MCKFYADHIQFQILIAICEFCQTIIHRKRCDRKNGAYVGS